MKRKTVKATAEKSAESPTPTATVTTAPTAPVDNGEPLIITSGMTNVRRGPGLDYEVSHVLGAGTTAPILGRNGAGDWWAVPGPGDVGWISDEDVDLSGPCATPEPSPERIHFAPGATSITLEGMLESSQ